MDLSIFVVIVGITVNAVLSYPILVRDDDQDYVLVPIRSYRIKRQTSLGFNQTGFDFSHTGVLFSNNVHSLQGTAFGSQEYGGPLTLGGNVDYSHIPSGSTFSLGVSNTAGLGADISAEGRYNIYQSPDGKTTAGLSGQYNQHIGGASGSSNPEFGVFLGLSHEF